MQQDVGRNIKRASLLLMGSILLSRVIGFFREWVLAHRVGANALTDVYYASFTIPDLLNYLMAAGALSLSFIPVLSGFLAEGKTEEARRLFRTVVTYFGAALVVLVLLAAWWAEPLARAVAPGFGEDQVRLLAFLIRIILPAQFFFYFGGVATAVQHTHGQFLHAALAPIVYNLGIIGFGLWLQPRYGVVGFSIGVTAGAAAGHGLLQWLGLRRLGYGSLPLLRPGPEIWAGVRRYLWLSLPIMIGFSIVITDEWFAKYFATYLAPSAVSYLQYARTEMRIPVAVIGQAAGVASFPFLARLWSGGEKDRYGATLLREIERLWALSLVATVLFVTHAEPITRAIYGGGRFLDEDVRTTAEVLRYFGPGMFFLTVQGLLSRGFYACQRTWLPSLVGTATSAVSLAGYWYLSRRMGVYGLALAGSLAFALYALVLWGLLRRHLAVHCPSLSLGGFYRFLFLWSLVGGALWLLARGILALGLHDGTRLGAFLASGVGALVMGAVSVGLLRTVFRRMTGGPLF